MIYFFLYRIIGPKNMSMRRGAIDYRKKTIICINIPTDRMMVGDLYMFIAVPPVLIPIIAF